MVYARLLRAKTEVLPRQDYDPLNLRGRIELVSLSRPAIGPNSAIGEVLRNDQNVLVTNGHRFIGKTCLVRFDLETKVRRFHPDVEILHGDDEAIFGDEDELYPLRGNFISTGLPFGFEKRAKEGIAPTDYILYTRWDKKMRKGNKYPTLDEVNMYFDPGRIGEFMYIGGKSYAKEGLEEELVLINLWGERTLCRLFGIGDLLPDPTQRSRVVIAESKRRIKRLIEEIKAEGLVPIKMEPYNNFLVSVSNPNA